MNPGQCRTLDVSCLLRNGSLLTQ